MIGFYRRDTEVQPRAVFHEHVRTFASLPAHPTGPLLLLAAGISCLGYARRLCLRRSADLRITSRGLGESWLRGIGPRPEGEIDEPSLDIRGEENGVISFQNPEVLVVAPCEGSVRARVGRGGGGGLGTREKKIAAPPPAIIRKIVYNARVDSIVDDLPTLEKKLSSLLKNRRLRF